MTFGEKIKQARTAKKLTQKQLAEKINAKHNSISDWEKISASQTWTLLSFYVAFWK